MAGHYSEQAPANARAPALIVRGIFFSFLVEHLCAPTSSSWSISSRFRPYTTFIPRKKKSFKHAEYQVLSLLLNMLKTPPYNHK